MDLILHVSHPDIDLAAFRKAGPMPAWLSAIAPFLDPESDIRDGSMTLLASLKDLPTLTQRIKLHLPGAVIRRRVVNSVTA